jgi:hypothetical protein
MNHLGYKSPERREAMEDTVTIKTKPARPMIVITDRDGNRWLCDKDVDPNKDLAEQGCWQCGDEHFAFTRND